MIPGSGSSLGEGIGYLLQCSWAFLVAQMVKNPPAVWETWVRFLGWESPAGGRGNPLLPGESPRTEESGGLYSMWSHRVGHN